MAQTIPGDKLDIGVGILKSLMGSLGLKDFQAAGIAGNMYKESGFDPGATNGSHDGLVQWNKSYISSTVQKLYNKSRIKDCELQQQLDFLKYTVTSPGVPGCGGWIEAFERLKQTSTIRDATLTWMEKYERCENYSVEITHRLPYAEQVYQAYKGGKYTGAAVAAQTSGGTAAVQPSQSTEVQIQPPPPKEPPGIVKENSWHNAYSNILGIEGADTTVRTVKHTRIYALFKSTIVLDEMSHSAEFLSNDINESKEKLEKELEAKLENKEPTQLEEVSVVAQATKQKPLSIVSSAPLTIPDEVLQNGIKMINLNPQLPAINPGDLKIPEKLT